MNPVAGFPWRSLLKIGGILILILAGNLFTDRVLELLHFELLPSNERIVHRMIMVLAVVYIVLLALPFVPGVEIGLTLIAMLGPPIVFLVYISTVVGLLLGFFIGRLVSISGPMRLFHDLGLRRAGELLEAIEPLSKDERLVFLATKAPARIVPFLLRHRYLALGILLNLPGNFLVGGGGGIAMIAGVSGLYSIVGYFLTVVIAVAPVPIAVLLFGSEFLAG